jgi:hypothetical protein
MPTDPRTVTEHSKISKHANLVQIPRRTQATRPTSRREPSDELADGICDRILHMADNEAQLDPQSNAQAFRKPDINSKSGAACDCDCGSNRSLRAARVLTSRPRVHPRCSEGLAIYAEDYR